MFFINNVVDTLFKKLSVHKQKMVGGNGMSVEPQHLAGWVSSSVFGRQSGSPPDRPSVKDRYCLVFTNLLSRFSPLCWAPGLIPQGMSPLNYCLSVSPGYSSRHFLKNTGLPIVIAWRYSIYLSNSTPLQAILENDTLPLAQSLVSSPNNSWPKVELTHVSLTERMNAKWANSRAT